MASGQRWAIQNSLSDGVWNEMVPTEIEGRLDPGLIGVGTGTGKHGRVRMPGEKAVDAAGGIVSTYRHEVSCGNNGGVSMSYPS